MLLFCFPRDQPLGQSFILSTVCEVGYIFTGTQYVAFFLDHDIVSALIELRSEGVG